MKNFRSSFLLAAVAVGLFCYLFFFDRSHKGTAEKERAETVLFGVDAEKVTHLKITDPDGVLTLEKQGQGPSQTWRILQPVATDADPEAVHAILSELQYLQSRRTISFRDLPQGSQTLLQWGLTAGNNQIEFSGDGFSDQLVIGRKTALSDLVYARALLGKEGVANGAANLTAPVYLIPVSSRDAVDKKLADLRSHVVLKVDPLLVHQCGLSQTPVTVTGSTAVPVEYELQRDGTTWKLEKPLSAAADAHRVTAWLGRLGSLQVKQFISDDASNLSTYGLSAPSAQIWIENKDAKIPETLLIGLPVASTSPSSPGEVYAKRLSDNAIFTLAANDVEALLRDLPETRDRKVISFTQSDVTTLKIEDYRVEAKTHLFAVQKEGKASTGSADSGSIWVWSEASSGDKIDGAKINEFLTELSSLQADRIVSDTTSDLKPYGLDRPSVRITLSLKKAEKNAEAKNSEADTITLLLGKGDKGQAQIYAKNSQQPFIYGLEASFLNTLPEELSPLFVPPSPVGSVGHEEPSKK